VFSLKKAINYLQLIFGFSLPPTPRCLDPLSRV
jgi:hypothetical protein